MHNYFFCFVRYSREKVFWKKKSGQLQRKVEKVGQTAKIIILYAFSIITDDRNDILILFFVRYAPGWK
jgi:hypothetical protein